MSVKLHNVKYTQKLNKKEYTAPREVVSSLTKNGFTITSGNSGKTIQVQRRVNGKTIYFGTLASYLRNGQQVTFRDNNSRNITLRNVKVKTK